MEVFSNLITPIIKMNKKLITTIITLAAVCSEVSAQPKEGGRCPAPIYARDFSKIEMVDTTRLRVRYAFCAEKISDHLTYIDLQRLDVGKRITKYYSQFVYQSDSLRSKYAKEHPGAQAVPSWMGVQCREHDQWSEYEWSDYFIENGQLTEYCQMPMWLHRYNSKYTEPVPKQEWKLTDETQTILGHHCQKATCRFRGRDFVAWFAADIPVKRGPWKFSGLPGLILKAYDKEKLYTWEAIGLETHRHLCIFRRRLLVIRHKCKQQLLPQNAAAKVLVSPEKKGQFYTKRLYTKCAVQHISHISHKLFRYFNFKHRVKL